jgi:lipopolysaccharide transport system ATP-binding protein
LVDEVLAVGDLEFQRKCLGKIDEVARYGRTVLFVSHNMIAIEALCKTAIFLDSGRLKMIGPPADVVSAYAKLVTDTSAMSADLRQHSGRTNNSTPLLEEVSVVSRGREPTVIRMGDSILIAVKFDSPTAIRPCCSFTIKTDRGLRVFHVSTLYSNQHWSDASANSGVLTCALEGLPLMPGRYFIDLWLQDLFLQSRLDAIADACCFEVVPANLLGSGRLPPTSEGPIFMNGQWSLSSLPSPGPGSAESNSHLADA